MPARTDIIVTDANYTARSIQVDTPIAIDDDVTHWAIEFDRDRWLTANARVLIEWRALLSIAKGRWTVAGWSSTHGGVLVLDDDGVTPLTKSRWQSTLPPGRSRRMKFKFKVNRRTDLKASFHMLVQ